MAQKTRRIISIIAAPFLITAAIMHASWIVYPDETIEVAAEILRAVLK